MYFQGGLFIVLSISELQIHFIVCVLAILDST
jgi:hypothetical protein